MLAKEVPGGWTAVRGKEEAGVSGSCQSLSLSAGQNAQHLQCKAGGAYFRSQFRPWLAGSEEETEQQKGTAG